jgi:hypothetical protein
MMDVHISSGSIMVSVLSIHSKELESIISGPGAKGNEISVLSFARRFQELGGGKVGMHWVAEEHVRAGHKPGPDIFAARGAGVWLKTEFANGE